MMSMTSAPPTSACSCTDVIARLMKIELSFSTVILIPVEPWLMRSISWRTPSAICTVLVPDCLVMLSRTPGRPLIRVKLRKSSVESVTSAMSFMYTGTPARVMTTRSRISSMFSNWPWLRTRYVRSPSSISPRGIF
jgi:hypothetical protein